MSKALSSYLTGVVFGAEGTQGVISASLTSLWDSADGDSLSLGETPFDAKPLRGARGQLNTSFRECQNLPGGDLGAAPISLGTEAPKFLQVLQAHLQNVSVTGTEAPYTYAGTPAVLPVEEGDWYTLSFVKDTAVASQAHVFLGCVVDELELSWKAGEPIMYVPKGIKAMSSSTDGTAPTLPSPSAGGYLQAPSISCTWNGTEVYPASWKINSKQNFADRQSGNAKGRIGFVLGDYEGAVEMSVWRNEDSHDNWVNPFYTGSTGTLVITASAPVANGTLTGGLAPTLVYTAYCRVDAPNDLNAKSGDLMDTVKLRTMADVSLPAFSVTQESASLL